MALRGDLGHGGALAAQQHGLRVMLVLLVGQGVAGGEDGPEEQHDADEGDADTAQVTEPLHRSDPAVSSWTASGRTRPGRGSATPSRAVRSTGSRCICLSLRRPPKTCPARPPSDPGGGIPLLVARAVDRGVLWPPPGRPPRPEGERRRSRRPGPVAVRRPIRAGSVVMAHEPSRRRWVNRENGRARRRGAGRSATARPGPCRLSARWAASPTSTRRCARWSHRGRPAERSPREWRGRRARWRQRAWSRSNCR